MKKKKILVSNDDGINAPGIKALVTALKHDYEVIVVAPDKQMSAVGHAITINSPLRVKEYFSDGEFFGYAVNGTPADCVKLALRSLLDEPPSAILSGVNHGANTSTSVMYSGTVSAATEGTFLGIPSVALSLCTYGIPDFIFAQKVAKKMAHHLTTASIPKGILLNVNIPAVDEKEIAGYKITRMGNSVWDDVFEHRKDPQQQSYYWLTGKLMIVDDADDQDEIAVTQNYVSITPIQFDLTAYKFLDELKTWKF